MINCLIVDDEEHAIKNLVHHVNEVPFLNLIASTTNPLKALELVNSQKIDLIFLDIQMPELSGIELIKTIKGRARVILTTAYSEFAIEGFELDVVDYLLKPVAFPRFLQAAQKVLNIITSFNSETGANIENTEEGFFFVKSEIKGKMLKVNFKEIDYVESLKNYVAIHYNGKKVLALQSLKDIEDRLPSKYFVRIHRSYIVALNRIAGVEGNMVALKNIKAELLLGETYKASFFERMKDKII